MIYLTFKQTQSELMVRAAATVIFNALLRAEFPRVRLSSLTEHPQYGFTASASQENLGIKLVRITDLQDGKISWDTVPYCQCEQPEKYLLKPNDILFARTGATTGKTHLVKEAPAAVFASYLIRVRPKGDGCSDYLYYFFQSDVYWRQIIEEKEGSAQPNVNGQKLMNIDVPIVDNKIQLAISQFLEIVRARQDGSVKELPELPPPLDEQRRIVARIEELAGKVEEARGLRRQSVEEAEALLGATLGHVFNGNSLNWELTTVNQLCDNPQYGYTESAQHDKVGPKFLRITDIQNGHVNWDTVPHCTCDASNLEKYRLQKGDILFARTGATTGKSFLIDECPDAVFASYLIKLKVRQFVIPEFLYWYFQSPQYWTQVREGKEGSAQPNMNGHKLSEIKVVFPDSQLKQQHIVAYLDNLQAKVDVLKHLQAETSTELDALLPSILDKAFKGEL